jgi:hypothetical protein
MMFGLFDQLLKRGHRNRKLVIVRVMIDDDVQPRKQVGDVMVKFDSVLHVQRLVIRHAKENTVGPRSFTKFIFWTTSRGLGLVTPIKSGTRFLLFPTVATARF